MGRLQKHKNTIAYYAPKSNTQVPSKIKCSRCNIVKNPQAFANKRLEDLKLHISKDKDKTFNAERQSLIACAQCTGAQVTELFCNGCDRWKGLDGFAKAQRKKPDQAKCQKCMQVQLSIEPGASSSEGDSGSGGEESDSDSDEGGATLPGTFSNLSITNGTSTANGSSTAGGVALASDTASMGSRWAPSHLRREQASVASSGGGTVGNNPNFAKVRKGHSERERKRGQEEEEEDVYAVNSDSDTDSN